MRRHELYTVSIEVDTNLINDAAKAAIPEAIQLFTAGLRAKMAFVGASAVSVEASVGSYSVSGIWEEEPLELRSEVTQE